MLDFLTYVTGQPQVIQDMFKIARNQLQRCSTDDFETFVAKTLSAGTGNLDDSPDTLPAIDGIKRLSLLSIPDDGLGTSYTQEHFEAAGHQVEK